jgi:hypothetical protein
MLDAMVLATKSRPLPSLNDKWRETKKGDKRWRHDMKIKNGVMT